MGQPVLLQLGREPKGNCDNNSYKRSKKKAGYLYWRKIDIRYLKRRYLLKQMVRRDSGIL